jgi:DNA-binding transcriptional MerR regulator
MSGNQGIMRIGEVHAQLRKYFPDIELSKIRYYEDKGLVQPSRSRKGYRLYSERDVDCLREAIRLAQEEFVPLRVVRLRLIEQGLLRDVPIPSNPRHAAREAISNVVSIPAPPAPVVSRPNLKVVPPSVDVATAGDQSYLSSSEFLNATGLNSAMMTQLHSLGLLAPVLLRGEIVFTEFDVQVGTVAATLIERGVDLRLLGSLRRVAEREVGLVDDLTIPWRTKGSELSGEQTRVATVELAAEVSALRSILYDRALAEYLTSST